MNKKAIWIVVVIVVLILIGFWMKGGSGEQNKSSELKAGEIKIGVLGPMTGPRGQIGEGLRKAVLMAQEDFGNTKNKVEFVFEDSAGESAKAASAVQKLINIDKVDALMSITSTDGNIVRQAANESKIPHFGEANDTNVEKGEYSFVHWVPAPIQADLVVKEFQKRGVTKVAILTEQQEAAIASYDAFIERIKGTNISVVAEERFVKDTNDFKTILSKIKASKPEYILMNSFSPAAENLKRQANDLGITVPFTSFAFHGTVREPALFEGEWYVSGRLSSGDWIAKFKEHAQFEPTIGSNYGYDIARIYLSIANTLTDTSSESIKKAIESFDYASFDSVVGKLSGLDAEGRIISEAAVLKIKDAKHVNYYE